MWKYKETRNFGFFPWPDILIFNTKFSVSSLILISDHWNLIFLFLAPSSNPARSYTCGVPSLWDFQTLTLPNLDKTITNSKEKRTPQPISNLYQK